MKKKGKWIKVKVRNNDIFDPERESDGHVVGTSDGNFTVWFEKEMEIPEKVYNNLNLAIAKEWVPDRKQAMTAENWDKGQHYRIIERPRFFIETKGNWIDYDAVKDVSFEDEEKDVPQPEPKKKPGRPKKKVEATV